METWVYFIHEPEAEVIKIGQTTEGPTKRMKQLARNNFGEKYKLELLAGVRGKKADEGFVHRYFAAERPTKDNESFSTSDRLVDYIRWLRDQWYVAVDEKTEREIERMNRVDSDVWLPEEGKRKPAPSSILPGFHGPLCLPGRDVTGDDFYTNEIIIEAARRVLGRIDLDPASHPAANQKVRADRFYTVHDNGLMKDWRGRVWLNPPFSEWGKWVPKILSEYASGRVKALCVLSAMRTVTAKYFAPLLDASRSICIMHGRIKFWGGMAGDSPDDGHCIFYFGNEVGRFEREFSSLGTCFKNCRNRSLETEREEALQLVEAE